MANDSAWQQMPRDAGQIVDVKYAVDWEHRKLLRRTEDRSTGSVVMEFGRIADGEDAFEPWNGVLPRVTEWVNPDTGGQ